MYRDQNSELGSVVHGGIGRGLLACLGVSNVPHHIVIEQLTGTVTVNTGGGRGFSFDCVPLN
jgi:hypothetical protein